MSALSRPQNAGFNEALDATERLLIVWEKGKAAATINGNLADGDIARKIVWRAIRKGVATLNQETETEVRYTVLPPVYKLKGGPRT